MNRRHFIRDLGVSASVLPFLAGLPTLRAAAGKDAPKRLIIMFSPNGTIPGEFWPARNKETNELEFGRILKAMEPWKDQVTTLQGLHNKVRGDGDQHMRGMSCLLTGDELFSGNVQGGGNTPAGWAKGISIDQELKNFYQSRPETETRFGSLQFGVAVPNRADPWTRMSYAGPNQPLAPISDPDQMLSRIYGSMKDKDTLKGVIDLIQDDLKKVSKNLGSEDRAFLDQHVTLVKEIENELAKADSDSELLHPVPEVDPEVELINDNTPRLSRMQIDLLVSAMANDMTRIGTLQFMRSVGQARMNWLGIEEGHHSLSHEPDKNKEATEKLVKINEWFAAELAYLTQRLAATPEPGRDGTMLDNTLVIWLNELGKGNSHSLSNIPFVLVGGKAHGIRGGQHHIYKGEPHNRLWLTVAQSMGHDLNTFGQAQFCTKGALNV